MLQQDLANVSARLLFRELLQIKGIDPAKVLVMRHKPWEKQLQKHFHWLAVERSDLFNAYQSSQYQAQENQLSRAEYLASFIGRESGKALFIGLYRNEGSRTETEKQYWSIPENQELRSLGMTGWDKDRQAALRFDLRLLDTLSDWKGRLTIEWEGGERSWSRWAKDNDFSVVALNDTNAVEPEFPPWDEIVWDWDQLKPQWPSWRAKLEIMRGIYLIFDKSDRKGYVGCACGDQNLYGRWTNYADTGHGGNKLLRPPRDPKNFRFSILELVSPAAPPEKVYQLEQSWKRRLSTADPLGLNEN